MELPQIGIEKNIQESDTLAVWNHYVKAQNYTDAGNYDSAVYLFTEAGNRYEEMGMWDNYVSCFNQSGELLIYLGNMKEADEVIKKTFSMGIKNLGEMHPWIADCYDNKGFYKYTQGYFDEALEDYQKALSIRLKTLGEIHPKIAFSYNNIGIYYSDKGRYNEAIKYYQKGLHIQLNTLDENDPYIASSYNNIGNIYNHIGKYDTAIFYYDKMYQIFNKTMDDDHPYYSFYYSGVAIAYSNLYDYKKSLDFQHKALAIRVANYGDASSMAGINYKSLAVQYNKIDEYKEALHYIEIALNIYLQHYGKDNYEVASCYNILGLIYKNKREYSTALNYYKKSVAINLLTYKEQHPNITLNYHNIACLYSELAEFDSAYFYFDKTINLQKNILDGLDPELAGSYNELGNTYLDDKKYMKAIESYQLAISANIEGFDIEDIFQNPGLNDALSKINLMRSLSGKAAAFYQYYKNQSSDLNDLEMSFNTYELVFKLIDLMQREYFNIESKLYLAQSTEVIMKSMILVAFDYYKVTQDYYVYTRIFEYAEKRKASILLEAIKSDEALSLGNLPEPLVNMEKSLKQEISAYKKLVYDEKAKDSKDTIKITTWNKKLFELNRQSDSLISSLESDYSQYYQLKYESGISDVKEIQNKIQEGQAIVEYRMSDTTLYTFVLTNKDYFMLPQKLDANFEQIANSYIGLLKNNETLNVNSIPNLWDLSFTIYSLLLEPVDSLLDVNSLIIIPDGIIGYIPFETLLTEKVKMDFKEYSKIPYLVKQYSISYAYSATLYSLSVDKKQNENDFTLLAMAPFSSNYSEIDNENEILSVLRERGIDQLSLPGTKSEIENINGLFPGRTYYDSTATEMTFWDNAKNYGLLHIASHGIIDDQNPMYSRLLFYKDQNDSLFDGELNTYELFNMQLNADLAVLSACNTGSGMLQKGEGIMSMARGFLYAGVPSIVMTLWSIDDQSSAELMSSFYSYLKDGKPKDEALRSAKLDYLANTKNPGKLHPRYWAGYVLIGDNSAIINRGYTRLILFSLLLITIMGIAVFFIRKKRRSF